MGLGSSSLGQAWTLGPQTGTLLHLTGWTHLLDQFMYYCLLFYSLGPISLRLAEVLLPLIVWQQELGHYSTSVGRSAMTGNSHGAERPPSSSKYTVSLGLRSTARSAKGLLC